MNEHLIVGLVTVLALGAISQWIAWRLRFPSILMLLSVGFVAGPVTNLVDPGALLGPATLPIVSIAAAIVLFEGGLGAPLSEIRLVAQPVRRLVTIGLLVTWALSAAAAHHFLDFSWPMALLLGAILVVTGPTVIGPLLRHVKPKATLGSLIKLEGILNDPVGAVLAILVFQAVRVPSVEGAFWVVVTGIIKTAAVALLLGIGGAFLIQMLLKKRWLPAFLTNSSTITLALVVFTASNHIQSESGLFSVTIMGIALASQRSVDVRPIVEFAEHITVAIISVLFVLLAARIELTSFSQIPLGVVAFILALILVVRPLATYLSTIGTSLSWKERVFLAWLAPRGIVAAAVSSVFGIRLTEEGFQGAGQIMPVTFLVIVSTVAVYGLSAAPLARILRLGDQNPAGFLIVGADRLARAFAQCLKQEGVPVVLVDSDRGQVTKARMAGLDAQHAHALSEHAMSRLDYDGLGRMIALLPNDEANALCGLHFQDVFGHEVYQLTPSMEDDTHRYPIHLRARYFASGHTHEELTDALLKNGEFKVTTITEQFTYEAFQETYDNGAIPLVAWSPSDGAVRVLSPDGPPLAPGEKFISLVHTTA